MTGIITNKWFFILFILAVISCKGNKHEGCSDYAEEAIKNIRLSTCLKSYHQKDSTAVFRFDIAAVDSQDILKYGLSDKDAYLQRIYYFSYLVEKDIWLESDLMRIPASGAVFERNYNLTNTVSMTVTFNKIAARKYKFVYNMGIFDLSPVKLNVDIKK